LDRNGVSACGRIGVHAPDIREEFKEFKACLDVGLAESGSCVEGSEGSRFGTCI
jgi:hypothetical protein